MKRLLALSALLVWVASGTARADVAPPNSTECTSLTAGAACVDDHKKAGVCTSQTCTVLDYSDGSPPGTKQVPCVLCIAPDGGTTTSGSSSGGGCAVAQTPAGGGFWLIGVAAMPFLLRRRAGPRSNAHARQVSGERSARSAV